ncbi:MAG: sulfotransferase domain-containing protein [Bacteroidales bacterium]|nr:sulfotransferase domain-containing protein [Bacteroidales bacterium]
MTNFFSEKTRSIIRNVIIIVFTYPYSMVGYLLRKKTYANIQSLCLFIGYPRSGHSLIGAIIDAHPNAVISQELDFVKLYNWGFSMGQLYFLIEQNAKRIASKGRNNSGYSYEIEGLWQGTKKDIRVIGDKKGGLSTKRFIKKNNISQIQNQIPLKFIHVVRNPFDNIATMIKKDKPYTFKGAFQEYQANALFIESLIMSENHSIYTVFHEDLIQNPHEFLKKMCAYLQIPFFEDFADKTNKIIFATVHKSSKNYSYTETEIKQIYKLIDEVTFLKNKKYTFEKQL